MKKALVPILLVIMTVCATRMSAQDLYGMGALGLGIPVSDFSDKHGVGIGLIAQGRYKLEPQLWLTGTLGYRYFNRKSIEQGGSIPVTYEGSASIIPVTVGGIYEIGTGKLVPYLSAELGFFFLGATIEKTTLGVTSETSYNRNEFGLIPGAGFLYPLNETLTLDASLKYHWIFGNAQNDVTSINFFSLNVGVMFPLN